MNDLLLNIDTGAINWARAQFALTAIYHWLFVPLTLGLAVIMGIAETCYYRTKETFWKDTAKFWQRLFGINFAMGVATGIILEFEFGTNWSNYSWFVGDILVPPSPLRVSSPFSWNPPSLPSCISDGIRFQKDSTSPPPGSQVWELRSQHGGFSLPMPGCNILWAASSTPIRCVMRWSTSLL